MRLGVVEGGGSCAVAVCHEVVSGRVRSNGPELVVAEGVLVRVVGRAYDHIVCHSISGCFHCWLIFIVRI